MEEKSKINTANPEAITYSTEELGFTVLGGIRLDGLDRLSGIATFGRTKKLSREYPKHLTL